MGGGGPSTPPAQKVPFSLLSYPGGPRPWTLLTVQYYALEMCQIPTFFFRSGIQALSVRAQVQNLEEPQCNPRTLGVLCPLLVVEGQVAQPQLSRNRKQAWVCSADAGVCIAWKAVGEISN